MVGINKLKPLCKNIIVVYTHHVRNRVREGNIGYIKTGINEDLYVYKSLFLDILGLALGVKDAEPAINTEVKEETIMIIKREISRRKYRRIAENYRLLVFTTCELIFCKVMEEILNDSK